jgi:hypothetical protein
MEDDYYSPGKWLYNGKQYPTREMMKADMKRDEEEGKPNPLIRAQEIADDMHQRDWDDMFGAMKRDAEWLKKKDEENLLRSQDKESPRKMAGVQEFIKEQAEADWDRVYHHLIPETDKASFIQFLTELKWQKAKGQELHKASTWKSELKSGWNKMAGWCIQCIRHLQFKEP